MIPIHNLQQECTVKTGYKESSTYQFNDIDNDGTPDNNASLAPATAPE